MIAKCVILLPYVFHIPDGEGFQLRPFKRGDYRIVVLPPAQAPVRSSDLSLTGASTDAVLDGMVPTGRPAADPWIRLGERPMAACNLLVIQFQKEEFRRDFDPEAVDKCDPPPALIYAVANSFLSRIRTLTQDSSLRLVDPSMTAWRVDYFTDEGKPVAPDPTNRTYTRRASAPGTFVCHGVTTGLWDAVHQLPPDHEPPAWETLILDAEALLPDVNAALVLAAAALETFINECLDRFAEKSAVPGALWGWINERDFWLKNPSTEDQFGDLLKVFTGKSLKDEPHLWRAFKNLRTARNKLAPEGVARVGNERVTVEVAAELISRAHDIINWVEGLLPAEQRRPRFNIPEGVTVQTKMAVPPDTLLNELTMSQGRRPPASKPSPKGSKK